MNSEQLSKWTAIITNIAVVIGLIFVGLEFRNNTNTLEIERLDNYTEGMRNNSLMLAKNGELARIFIMVNSDPEALSADEIFRYEQYLLGITSHIERLSQYRQRELLSESLWEREISGAGFMFSNDVGLRLLRIMDKSDINTPVWKILESSARRAKEYCIDINNECLAPFQ
jgi:hypothetical protein